MVDKVALIGDVGGHADPFADALEDLGVNLDKGTIPAGLVICQVGDLIHRGPDSLNVIKIVEKFIGSEQWVQLAGNHEMNELTPEPIFLWRENVHPYVVRKVREWWSEDLIDLATSFSTLKYGDVLVTHAGLTNGLWSLLGMPDEADVAASIINGAKMKLTANVHDAGMMMDKKVNDCAGVYWAETRNELIGFWADDVLPFSMVHGHCSAFNWYKGEYYQDIVKPAAMPNLSIDKATKHVVAKIGDNHIVGIDPCHGIHPQYDWAPLVLELKH